MPPPASSPIRDAPAGAGVGSLRFSPSPPPPGDLSRVRTAAAAAAAPQPSAGAGADVTALQEGEAGDVGRGAPRSYGAAAIDAVTSGTVGAGSKRGADASASLAPPLLESHIVRIPPPYRALLSTAPRRAAAAPDVIAHLQRVLLLGDGDDDGATARESGEGSGRAVLGAFTREWREPPPSGPTVDVFVDRPEPGATLTAHDGGGAAAPDREPQRTLQLVDVFAHGVDHSLLAALAAFPASRVVGAAAEAAAAQAGAPARAPTPPLAAASLLPEPLPTPSPATSTAAHTAAAAAAVGASAPRSAPAPASTPPPHAQSLPAAMAAYVASLGYAAGAHGDDAATVTSGVAVLRSRADSRAPPQSTRHRVDGSRGGSTTPVAAGGPPSAAAATAHPPPAAAVPPAPSPSAATLPPTLATMAARPPEATLSQVATDVHRGGVTPAQRTMRGPPPSPLALGGAVRSRAATTVAAPPHGPPSRPINAAFAAAAALALPSAPPEPTAVPFSAAAWRVDRDLRLLRRRETPEQRHAYAVALATALGEAVAVGTPATPYLGGGGGAGAGPQPARSGVSVSASGGDEHSHQSLVSPPDAAAELLNAWSSRAEAGVDGSADGPALALAAALRLRASERGPTPDSYLATWGVP